MEVLVEEGSGGGPADDAFVGAIEDKEVTRLLVKGKYICCDERGRTRKHRSASPSSTKENRLLILESEGNILMDGHSPKWRERYGFFEPIGRRAETAFSSWVTLNDPCFLIKRVEIREIGAESIDGGSGRSGESILLKLLRGDAPEIQSVRLSEYEKRIEIIHRSSEAYRFRGGGRFLGFEIDNTFCSYED